MKTNFKLFESIEDYEVLGTNESHWGWEDDVDNVYAKILLDKNKRFMVK